MKSTIKNHNVDVIKKFIYRTETEQSRKRSNKESAEPSFKHDRKVNSSLPPAETTTDDDDPVSTDTKRKT